MAAARLISGEELLRAHETPGPQGAYAGATAMTGWARLDQLLGLIPSADLKAPGVLGSDDGCAHITVLSGETAPAVRSAVRMLGPSLPRAWVLAFASKCIFLLVPDVEVKGDTQGASGGRDLAKKM
jgi:hypothetical protein